MMGAKGSSEASLTIYEVTQPKYLHWLSSLLKTKLWSPQNLPVAKRAPGNGQRTSNLVTGYAKRMRSNGQLFGETESVAVTCIYVDEITVTCIVECRKTSECVQYKQVAGSACYTTLTIWRLIKAKVLFCPMLQDSLKTIAVWRFTQFVRLSVW